MQPRLARSILLAFVTCAVAQAGVAAERRTGPAPVGSSVPLTFEPNVGQAPPFVEFLARGPSHGVLLRRGSAALVFHHAETSRADRGKAGISLDPRWRRTVVVLRLLDASPAAGVPTEPSATRSNYFRGKDPAAWRSRVPHFGRVTYPDVLPGIDVAYHANGAELEQDFILAPGASASSIRIVVDGVRGLTSDASGDLLASTDGGGVRFRKPVAWQESGGGRVFVDVAFAPVGADRVMAFRVGPHDATLPLVIDPVVAYATYVGGTEYDEALDLAVDAAGSAWICGTTISTDFPTIDPFQPGQAGGGGNLVSGDAFVTKLSPAGDSVEFSSYLGGASGGGFGGGEAAFSLALDGAGNAYLAGATTSLSFPTTPGAFQPAHGGEAGCTGGCSAAFVTKLDPAGATLLYSTYLGGRAGSYSDGPRFDYFAYDRAWSIAVDATGRAIVAGITKSAAFPVTAGAPQGAHAGGSDAFVTVLDPAGASLDFSTFLGGPLDDDAHAVAAVPGNRIVVAGHAGPGMPTTSGSFMPAHAGAEDGFVIELDRATGAVAWGTYLGGRGPDQIQALAVGATGEVTVTGEASSQDFPISSALQPVKVASWDAFAARLTADGASLAWSTWLGGRGEDHGRDVGLDASGRAVIVGETYSIDFPLQDSLPLSTACDPDDGCDRNAFVSIVQPDGASLCWSELFGGPGIDMAAAVAVTPAGIHVAGMAQEGLATTPGAFQETLDAADWSSPFVMFLTGFSCP